MRPPHLTEALEFGIASEEIEIILPPLWGLAEVALQAGDPDRALGICRDALARSVAVDERVLLTPFVVTGVRAAQQAGRPAEAAAWLAACETQAGVDPGGRRRRPRPRARDGGPRRKARPGSPAPHSNRRSTAGTGTDVRGRPPGPDSTSPTA